MNRILFVARRAKGWTEKQVADILQIEEAEYLRWECNLEKLPYPVVEKLADIYHIHAAYFMLYDAFDIRERLDILRQYKEALSAVTSLDLPAKIYIDAAKLGIESLMLQDELKASWLKQVELEQENSALRALFQGDEKKYLKKVGPGDHPFCCPACLYNSSQDDHEKNSYL